ncbi:hypothetical protein [Parasphingorhabdus cellanae]|uniref:Uncharacterized protein n=1 Tax=Parasphingorhabdus cellanae TaxID=2806553 RepID=A0ABX7T4L5_9SPHN|nr:hypothetical protein [Parasphingorhabdus cellanae]QTD55487.1 hypothetical protein J4G78_14940 [Parasphingorhabdus cellanae]
MAAASRVPVPGSMTTPMIMIGDFGAMHMWKRTTSNRAGWQIIRVPAEKPKLLKSLICGRIKSGSMGLVRGDC